MNRLIDEIVLSGFTAACRRASSPTRRSPDLVKATTEGVIREPSALRMTTGASPSMTAITDWVVPRSIPRTLAISPSIPGSCAVNRRSGIRRAGVLDPAGLRAAAGCLAVEAVDAHLAGVDVQLPVDGDRGPRVHRDEAPQAGVVVELEDVAELVANGHALVAARLDRLADQRRIEC